MRNETKLPTTDLISAPTTNTNTLEYVVPTVFVTLPSAGRFYPKDHPLYDKKEIEIRHMRAPDEEILSDVQLMQRGVAIEKLLSRIIIDDVDPLHMLSGDRAAIIIAARITAYGADYNVTATCPQCNTIDRDVCVNLLAAQRVTPWDEYKHYEGITLSDIGTLLAVFPETQFQFEFRLMTGYIEQKLMELQRVRKQKKLGRADLLDRLRFLIVSVQSVTDQGQLVHFINETLPAYDASYFRALYEKLNPSVQLFHNFTCEECGTAREMEVPLNAEFFWPKREVLPERLVRRDLST